MGQLEAPSDGLLSLLILCHQLYRFQALETITYIFHMANGFQEVERFIP